MILQRLASAIRHQNWSQIITEILIVVIGIFLGLQVTDWNEERKTQIVKNETLHNLTNDFREIYIQSKERTDFHRSIAEDLQYLLKVIKNPDNDQLDQSRLERALGSGAYSVGNPKASATWQALVSSGNQHWIEDEALRQAIIEYHRGLDEARDAYMEVRMVLTEYAKDFQRHFELRDDYIIADLINRDSFEFGIKQFDLNAMAADNDFHKANEQFAFLQFIYLTNHQNNTKNAAVVLEILDR